MPPDERSLREAALAHLARYETTREALLRVLERRIDRWARAAANPEAADPAALRAVARRIVGALAGTGAVDDARFAARRASLHARTGRSARASRSLLAVSGVPASLAEDATARDDALELEAAVVHARKRRLGPFAPLAAEDPASRHRTLASFARAGFAAEIARAVLAMDVDEATALIDRLRART